MAKSCRELQRVLVTGATGHVGAAVIDALAARGLPWCAADLSRRDRFLDYQDPSTWDDALEGCDALFLVRPSSVDHMESTILPFLDAALARGIGHVVFLSVLGAEKNRQVPHHAIERHLRDKNVSYTFLRPGFFAQNLGLAYRADIADDGRLFLPAGRGRVAFVDVRDVAELAALVFEDPDPHRGAVYACTGSEALSFEEAARLMSDVVHRPIRYEAASVGNYVRHLRTRGMPLAQISVQTVLHVGLRSGELEVIDETLGELLGRAPRTLASYVRENAELWRSTSPRAIMMTVTPL